MKEMAESLASHLCVFRRHLGSRDTFSVESNEFCSVARSYAEGRYILRYHGVGGNEAVISDPNELVETDVSSNRDPVADLNVTSNTGMIRNRYSITQLTVMSHVAVCHKEVMVPNSCHTFVVIAAERYGSALKEAIVVANN